MKTKSFLISSHDQLRTAERIKKFFLMPSTLEPFVSILPCYGQLDLPAIAQILSSFFYPIPLLVALQVYSLAVLKGLCRRPTNQKAIIW